MDVKLKPEITFRHGNLFLYMILAARLLYSHRWKEVYIPTMEEQTLKLMESAEMVKLIALFRHNNLTKIFETWTPLLDFLQAKEKNQLLTLGFED